MHNMVKFLPSYVTLGRTQRFCDIGDFVTHLKTLSQDCDFLTLRDSLVKDMIICGVTDNKLRERFLREADLDLDEAIKLGQAAEETKKTRQRAETGTRTL